MYTGSSSLNTSLTPYTGWLNDRTQIWPYTGLQYTGLIVHKSDFTKVWLYTTWLYKGLTVCRSLTANTGQTMYIYEIQTKLSWTWVYQVLRFQEQIKTKKEKRKKYIWTQDPYKNLDRIPVDFILKLDIKSILQTALLEKK